MTQSSDKEQSDKKQRLTELYDTGATTIYACQTDPRFSYTLYVPHRLTKMDRHKTTLLISIHGTGRMQSLYRDLFAEFAEYNNCIVLAPLFPAGVIDGKSLSGYKYLEEDNLRYDLLMLGMIDEVSQRYRISTPQVLMFGFSGGGHFTHRFTLLHPQRIRAASIGAPGVVTLLDRSRPWPAGIADCHQRFHLTPSDSLYRQLNLHFVVGGADTETWEIDVSSQDSAFIPGVNDQNTTRKDRLLALADSFARAGAKTRIDIVAGANHDVTQIIHTTRDFFADMLQDN